MGIKKMVIIKSLEHPGQNPHFRLAKLSRLCTIRSAPWVSYATGFRPQRLELLTLTGAASLNEPM